MLLFSPTRCLPIDELALCTVTTIDDDLSSELWTFRRHDEKTTNNAQYSALLPIPSFPRIYEHQEVFVTITKKSPISGIQYSHISSSVTKSLMPALYFEARPMPFRKSTMTIDQLGKSAKGQRRFTERNWELSKNKRGIGEHRSKQIQRIPLHGKPQGKLFSSCWSKRFYDIFALKTTDSRGARFEDYRLSIFLANKVYVTIIVALKFW